MNIDPNEQQLTQEQIAKVLYQCHEGLVKAYKSQKLFSDELYYLGQLAKNTGDLVSIDIEKEKIRKINNQKGDK